MVQYLRTLSTFFRLPFSVQWRTFLVQLPRYVPLPILHITSPDGPHPFIIALPSREAHKIPIYVFIPPTPRSNTNGEASCPVLLDFHGGGFIMGSPLEQAPFCAMMSRKLGAVVISASYRLGPFHQFPAAIHDAEDVLAAILDTEGETEGGRVLRQGIQKHYTMLKSGGRKDPAARAATKITLDPTHLSISGFSAGGNLALNLALSIPASYPLSPSGEGIESPPSSPGRLLSTKSDLEATEISDPWPSLLPHPHAHPTLIPLLLFYPSLDARLPPHQRPLPPTINPTADNTNPEKPRVPGLFSIMGPTYLPKRLRAHPRASPGLISPEHGLHKNVGIFLVLPERDSLAVQSSVWVNKMNEAGWDGPVRHGDSSDAAAKTETGEGSGGENGGLEVWHAPGCRHGWTQFPETWLGKHEKKERVEVFKRALEFVSEGWGVEVQS
ncbi:alpha/beta-hydrolase [Lepidopterella palustris CBS 459.81]|uniref:Alpha/beta-hydrolase n=1 Tax=Lepidopterella palustris CBS 459.81 TaxID=1314670 RepID=A0A8E2EBU1_9PEZI|nr:alpha/beta-hydrolase [Lepidopterella palustris CBS 459.81]